MATLQTKPRGTKNTGEQCVVLCAAASYLSHPERLGLNERITFNEPWLKVISNPVEARAYMRSHGRVREVWVAGQDEVSPINVAAAIKKDVSNVPVYLFDPDMTGSVKTRAAQACLDEVLSRQAFAKRYVQWARSQHKQAETQQVRMQEAAPSAMETAPLARVEETKTRSVRPKYTESRGSAFLLPIVSGSGGAGKSTVAALSAMVATRMGYKTLLVDLDLQFGDTDAILGIKDPLRIDEVLDNPIKKNQLISSGKLALLAAPQFAERAEELAGPTTELIAELRDSFELIVMNTGSFWTEQQATVLENCSRALFLVDQRPSSLRACKHALELCNRCGIAIGPFLFVVNRCAKGALYTSIDISCSLHGAQAIELSDGGPDIEEFISSGQTEELLNQRNQLCLDIEQMLMGILPDTERVAEKINSQPSRRRKTKGLPLSRKGKELSCL